MRLSDQEQRALVQRARGDDPVAGAEALQALLDDFRGPALAAAHKTLAACGIDGAHAEEVLQEASLKFFRRGLSDYRGAAAPRTYFVRIAVNAALDAGRRLARTGELDEGRPPAQLSAAPSAEEDLSAAQRRQALERCLEQLEPRYRRPVELYYLEEVGECGACGEELGISKSAFMQRLSRARVKLADCIRRRLR